MTRWAAEPFDLLRELRELKPTVVHFSGHGGRGLEPPGPAGARDVASIVAILAFLDLSPFLRAASCCSADGDVAR